MLDEITLLLVEDNRGDARLVQLALAEWRAPHFRIDHLERLDAAIDALARSRYDAVLLDLSLPDSHGLETVSRLTVAAPTVPIVVLSGHHDEQLAFRAVQHGAQDYLVKGQGDGAALARVVRYAIERKRTEEALRKAREELERRVEERTANLRALNEQLTKEIAQRLHAEEVLRREHDFISTVLDLVANLVIVLDQSGRIAGFNRACEEVTGYSVDEALGRRPWELFLPPEEVEATKVIFAQLRAGRFPNTHENRIVRKDGGKRTIDWSSSALLDPQGNVDFVIATGVDITELRRVEDMEKRRMLELAHVSRLSTMGEMATEIAHELNQPLTAITNYSKACARLLKRDDYDPADVAAALEGVAGQAQRAGEIIRQLRSFVGKEEGRRSTLEVNELVQTVVKLANVEARWHNVDVTTKLAPASPLVLGDKILLEQVLLNLARNAIEAMDGVEKGVRRLTICTYYDHRDEVLVAVEDTGPGLAADAMEKIFERFYTTKSNGMGMGLAICRSIVEAHGGRLWAAANQPQGAVLQFTLPVLKEGERGSR